MNDDGARLRLYAIEKRVALIERDSRTLKTWMFILVGLVLAAILVGAFELRHIVHLLERAL